MNVAEGTSAKETQFSSASAGGRLTSLLPARHNEERRKTQRLLCHETLACRAPRLFLGSRLPGYGRLHRSLGRLLPAFPDRSAASDFAFRLPFGACRRAQAALQRVCPPRCSQQACASSCVGTPPPPGNGSSYSDRAPGLGLASGAHEALAKASHLSRKGLKGEGERESE